MTTLYSNARACDGCNTIPRGVVRLEVRDNHTDEVFEVFVCSLCIVDRMSGAILNAKWKKEAKRNG